MNSGLCCEAARGGSAPLSPRLLSILVLVMCFVSSSLSAGLLDGMMDPEDGMLDASDYLASARGFLPVPIIITEPAVGYGFGVAVGYFHVSEQLDAEQHPHKGPPSISFGFGAITENDTWFVGGGHSGVWRDDHVRYTGALAGMSVNARFYGLNAGDDPGGNDNPFGVRFNSEGWLLYQSAKVRLRESNFWIGGSFIFSDLDNTFRLNEDLPVDIPALSFITRSSGLGLLLEYDSRNTTFTPSKGVRVVAEYKNFDTAWGGDFDYDLYQGGLFKYFALGDWSSLGVRLEGDFIRGDAPFYAYPFVDLRGIKALRYQGASVVVAEAELLWGLTPRWSLALFGGLGNATGRSGSGGDRKTVGAGGIGFRYRLARRFGLQAGVDIARGPEETSLYLTVGNAWGR